MQKAYAMNVLQEDLNEKTKDQLSLNEYVVPFRKISNIGLKTANSKLAFLQNIRLLSSPVLHSE